ncbi:hypothetical protein [Butyricicoccus intestinisimiae]|uniref:DUF370 domain-containing protein n=1 Tax=Butyricicoccus intestinisimiae TaxID=2841509 RepID=A0ABS6EUI9_9FIRM|nr:hypothetical protein [Butyricicoccus intestinisimiae]MBU5491341.1 hypothetical protein [Butyricicoccus intestinisimiae]
MIKVVTGYCITDKDGYIVLVGREKKKRRIVTIEEKSNVPVYIFQSKKRAETALAEMKSFDISSSANTYLRGICRMDIRRNKNCLKVVPCTVTFNY